MTLRRIRGKSLFISPFLSYSTQQLNAASVLLNTGSLHVKVSYWEEHGIGVVEVQPQLRNGSVLQSLAYSYHVSSVPVEYRKYVTDLVKLYRQHHKTA